MLIASSVSLPLETKDVSEAVHQVLDLLRSKVFSLGDVKISLNLTAMRFPDILVLWAKALPEEAESFGMDMSMSAGQFLQAHAAGQLPMPSICSCDATDYLSVSDTLALIESFFQTTPRAIRSTSFSIILENVNWRGSDGVGSGKIYLSDMKAFQRKQRFNLTAIYSCHGDNSKDTSVKKLFKRIASETGISFDKGKITEAIEPEILAKAELQQILAARICFEEAFEKAGREIRNRNLQWQGLPGLASKGESFDRRIESVYSGRKERVNFPGLIKRFMKDGFSDFTPWKDGGEQIIFSKPISSDLEMVLGFDRIHNWGLGKTFTLILGIKITGGPLVGRIWNDNFFRLFQQSTFSPCWTYITKVEIAEALDGASEFLRSTLSVFESEIANYLCPIPEKVPDSIPGRGAITAKQALGEALNVAKAWSEDAVLYTVSSSGILSLRESGMGPMINTHGFLQPHGCWFYCFYSPTKKRVLFIQVPSIGSLRCDESSCRQPFGSVGDSIFPTPINNWIDSDQAMVVAEENGGRAAREDAVDNRDIIAKLEIPRNRAAGAKAFLEEYSDKLPEIVRNNIVGFFEDEIPKTQLPKLRWNIHYLITKTKKRREDFIISFNAIDGKDIKISDG